MSFYVIVYKSKHVDYFSRYSTEIKSRQKVAKILNLKGGVGNFFPRGGWNTKGGDVCQGGVIPPLHAMVNE